MFDLSNEEGRKKYLIDKRQKDITLYNNILNGKAEQYKKYMNDEVFIADVKNRLKIDTELLNELLEDDKK